MTKMGDQNDVAVKNFEEITARDLTTLLGTDVVISFHSGERVNCKSGSPDTEWFMQDYINVDLLDTDGYTFNKYTESPELLEGTIQTIESEQQFYSGLLKSNCRVTSQPDWGDVFIYIKSNVEVLPKSILKYIVSFRDECHFHEEICECIYKRLQDAFDPSELLVMCLYARRGGIDINPVRASSNNLIQRFAKQLVDPDTVHTKTSKQ